MPIGVSPASVVAHNIESAVRVNARDRWRPIEEWRADRGPHAPVWANAQTPGG